MKCICKQEFLEKREKGRMIFTAMWMWHEEFQSLQKMFHTKADYKYFKKYIKRFRKNYKQRVKMTVWATPVCYILPGLQLGLQIRI